MTRLFNNKRALTLIETAIALLILGSVSAGLLFTAYSSLVALQNSKDINMAVDDMRALAEGLREQADADIDAVQSVSAYALPHINSTEQATVTVNTALDPKPVNVNISWQGQSQRAFSVMLDMLLSERG